MCPAKQIRVKRIMYALYGKRKPLAEMLGLGLVHGSGLARWRLRLPIQCYSSWQDTCWMLVSGSGLRTVWQYEVWHPNANHWLRWFGARLRIGSWLGIGSMEARIADLMLKQLAGHMLVAPWPIGTAYSLAVRVREKEPLLQTLNVFKKECKEKENKYMDKEIDLEKKIKERDNIVYKVGQSAQTVHMLTKPQVFYDDTHKQALGYQNPFYIKKAQRIKPTLYDGSIISRKQDVISVVDEEVTLILEEDSRLKILAKTK
ncbi:hypothetical protein Tco_0502540 [Tanacetum coccineum]